MPRFNTSRINNSVSGRVFDAFNYTFMAVYSITAILPFLYIRAGSFASTLEFRTRPFFIIPHTFNLESYKYVFTSSSILRATFVSVFRTVVGVAVNLFFTITMA